VHFLLDWDCNRPLKSLKSFHCRDTGTQDATGVAAHADSLGSMLGLIYIAAISHISPLFK